MNELIYIIFIKTKINILYFYKTIVCPFIYFYLTILSNKKERTNRVISLLIFIRIKAIVINI